MRKSGETLSLSLFFLFNWRKKGRETTAVFPLTVWERNNKCDKGCGTAIDEMQKKGQKRGGWLEVVRMKKSCVCFFFFFFLFLVCCCCWGS